MKLFSRNYIMPISWFLVAFLAIPFDQLARFSMMPGDIGDARLNNYFLENIYQYLCGHSASLIHLSFFYPFPYVLGFSDNLFGAAPVYLMARALAIEPDTSFQIWFFLGYLFNYCAAYWALRRLRIGPLGAVVGALVFSFALPVSWKMGHAQLHYRFGVPLAVAMFLEFLEKRRWYALLPVLVWLLWAFYCSIYIGFFLLLLLFAMFIVHLFREVTSGASVKKECLFYISDWRSLMPVQKVFFISGLCVFAVLLAVLFYPYWQVSTLYHAKRSLGEIASMLPRFQSYFLSDGSWIWSSQSTLFSNIPMRQEHQLFIGVVPMLLALMGYLVGKPKYAGFAYSVVGPAFVALIVLTLSMGGMSLWYLLANFPLASAIRAMTRIILVLLFPIAFFCALGIDHLGQRTLWGKKLILVLLLPAFLFEASATTVSRSPKAEWRSRIEHLDSSVPAVLPAKSILFFAQQAEPFFAQELDAMWVAMRRGVPTLNGYSGGYPPGLMIQYGRDCLELQSRVRGYLRFTGKENDSDAYTEMVRRIVPIGFDNCEPRH